MHNNDVCDTLPLHHHASCAVVGPWLHVSVTYVSMSLVGDPNFG